MKAFALKAGRPESRKVDEIAARPIDLDGEQQDEGDEEGKSDGCIGEQVRPHTFRVAALAGVCVIGWLFYLVISTSIIVAEPQRSHPQLAWQYDWHVYLAGAHDLVDGSLYREPLTLGSYPLPVSVFNLPPMSAAVALPFAPFGPELGGNIWLGLMVASIAMGTILLAAIAGATSRVLYAGFGLLAYTLSPWFRADVLLGNNNGIVFPDSPEPGTDGICRRSYLGRGVGGAILVPGARPRLPR